MPREGTHFGASTVSHTVCEALKYYDTPLTQRLLCMLLRIGIGSIRAYLVAACKWYSEAHAGPGAEARPGFRDSKNPLLQYVFCFGCRPRRLTLQHRCSLAQTHTSRNSNRKMGVPATLSF